MGPGLPELSQADLRVELVKSYQARRQHHLFAFYGTGVPEHLEIKLPHRDALTVQIVPVRSELELREKMPPLAGDDEARVAFLVPWTHDVPLDLAGRFVLNGRVRKIGSESRLQAIFGVGEVDDDARRSALAGLLVALAPGPRYALTGSRLTLDAMWAAWLRGEWGLDTEGGLALDMLLAFAASDGRGAAFVEKMAASAEGTKTREQLLEWLGRVLGPTGPVLWRTWESGRGRRALELALVCEPLAVNPAPAVRMWLKTKTRDVLDIAAADVDVMPIAEALGREVASALRILEGKDKKLAAHDLRAVARAADALVIEPEVQAALADSLRLPSAWTARFDALGAALSAGVVAGDAESVAAAARALRGLESHVSFKDCAPELLLRAEMAVRLLAWLVARPDGLVVAGQTPYAEAEVLGHWYALEGGYVDRARRAARGNDGDTFGRGVQAVVLAADAARTELDRRFAKSLVGWVDSGQPSSQVLPIHDAVKRIAATFLKGDAGRKLLVILMDGMAWAQATELLESLGQRAAPWGPLVWHAQKPIGESPLPVVFAALPTVTEVSRSAFFAGKAMGPGAKLGTEKDPERWAAHAEMKQLVTIGAGPVTDVPRLLLRAEGHTKAGGASQEALSLVADPKRRVVGVVVNAIDDSLKASHAQRLTWGVENIASLPDLLDKAREHGRAVLFASDHGHVPADRITRVPVAGGVGSGGARWRPWPAPGQVGHALADNEVGFTGTTTYRPPGAHGVVLLSDDASAYAGNTHAGEHGGATLAEVVTPCLLIGCEDVVGAAADDKSQKVLPAFVPRWWHFDVSVPVMVEVVVEAPVAVKPKDLQLDLLKPSVAIAAPVVVRVEAERSLSSAAEAFAKSEVLAARASAALKAQVVSAVDALLERDGVMSAEAFGVTLGMLSYRVGGFVSKLQEVLNLDGYEVMRFDGATRQVHLDRAKLAQLFEVTL